MNRKPDPFWSRSGVNIAHAAVARHAAGALGGRPALIWPAADGAARFALTYAELHRLSNRFARVLEDLGVAAGEVVAVQTGRIPPLYIAALGTWKKRCLFCPLYAAFGPEPVFHRLSSSRAAVLVTDSAGYRRTIADRRDRLPDLRQVILVDVPADSDARTRSWSAGMAAVSDTFTIAPTDPEDPASLHYTSGTTGMPKGAVHVHDGLRTLYATGTTVFDFRPGDIFWCTADPGWVTGTAYGIIAPLLHGLTVVVDSEDFDAGRWMRILAGQRVTIWYTSPSAIRRLMRSDWEPRAAFDLAALRRVFSVGEPLHAEAVRWARRAFGAPIYDTWWQTETGAVMISAAAAPQVRPGSMGWPIPGIRAAIVRRSGQDRVAEIDDPAIIGELALHAGWPSLFRGYLNAPEAYRDCFVGNWYLTGDLARRDRDGYYWFAGRADDIIKSSGHLVSPFEVESALMEHPAVVEAAVIGVADAMLGQRVKALVSLRGGFRPDEALRRELTGFARRRLGPAIAPRQIEFDDNLPKNRAGKIMRRTLREREAGVTHDDSKP